MSSTAWAGWLDRLEKARAEQAAVNAKVRSGNTAAVGASVFAVQQTVTRLKRDFDQLKRSSGAAVTKQEMDRRERLLELLVQDQKVDMDTINKQNGANRGANGHMPRDQAGNLLTMQNQIMKDQDQQLDFISKGVSNLKNYSTTMKSETELHVRLLDDIDNDVTRATDGLETEGARAAQVARQSSNLKLYMIILVLFVILIFLLLAGS